MKFLLDEGVPNSVSTVLKKHGHTVHMVNESKIVVRGSPDPIVAESAMKNDLILVALDGDMRALAKKQGYGAERYKKLSLMKISCLEPEAHNRIEELIDLIEYVWNSGKSSNGKRRFFVEILKTSFKVHI